MQDLSKNYISVQNNLLPAGTYAYCFNGKVRCINISNFFPFFQNYVFNKHTKHEPQHLRSFPHLRTKEPAMASVLRTRNAVEMEIHRYFQV